MDTNRYFDDLVQNRYSCRAFSAKPVSRELIEAILNDIRLAPSACNRQPWKIIVVDSADETGRKAVADAYPRPWIASAPLYIIMCGLPAQAWVRPEDNHNHVDVDVAIATEHLCLAATANGLGTCWVCNFNPDALSAGLNLPPEMVPVAIIPVGYPVSDAIPSKIRKSLDDIVIWH